MPFVFEDHFLRNCYSGLESAVHPSVSVLSRAITLLGCRRTYCLVLLGLMASCVSIVGR